jgi:gamma-glutamyltranspeptidase/glutathione hydrolase
VFAPRGIIATSHPLASAAGLRVLQDGGTAADAAVAAAAVLSVVEPHMTGIGGDMFALLWSARDARLFGLNGSGRSGSLMTRAALLERGADRVPRFGPASITVPGALAGWATLLQRFGTASLADLLEPAIRIADEGFPVSPIIAGQWQGHTERLRGDAGARATFLIAGQRAPRTSEWFRNPDYARTLRTIAQAGPDTLYTGELAHRLATHISAQGGFLTPADLATHESAWVAPLSVPFGDYRVWELPPNGQGLAVLEMLRILEGCPLDSMAHNSTDYLHTLIEAKKLAYADVEHYVGDPAHLHIPPEALLGDEFIAARRSAIAAQRAALHVEPAAAMVTGDTVYLCAADAHGNMISFINSLFAQFGSGVVVPGTGFALQNRGSGFTLMEGVANTVAPRKRPFHTLTPGFVTKTRTRSGVLRDAAGEEPWLAFGVMGAAMQPQGQVQVLLNLLGFGMDLQQAVDAPRFRHLDGLEVAIEEGIGDEAREALRARGHDVVSAPFTLFGGAQLVQRLERGWAAASDPRKDGLAIGS